MNIKERVMERRDDSGFTLIELLIAIVVVGILTAVAIVGIAGLTNTGAAASCQATIDASRSAVAVHYANTGGYPTKFSDMTGTTPPELVLAGGVTNPTNTTLTANGWTVTLGTNGALTASGATGCA